jgi:mannose-6-phosphate isomerase-like protein (cupin superfamily)
MSAVLAAQPLPAKSSAGRPFPSITKMRVPLLEIGMQDTAVYQSDTMWAHLKVYASGGENDMHAHPTEEHAFFILDGEARFFLDDGITVMGTKYDCVHIPKGAIYRFQSTGAGNLVMLRIGTGKNCHLPGMADERTDVNGRPFPNNPSQIAKGHDKPGFKPGKYWPDDTGKV